jgi:hypothetical protein
MTSNEDTTTAFIEPVRADDGARPQPSRRSVLRSAAGAGMVATAVAATGGTAVAAAIRPARSQARTASSDEEIAGHDGEPIVVHLRDARTGEIDLFHGTRQVRLHDREMAARLIRASR